MPMPFIVVMGVATGADAPESDQPEKLPSAARSERPSGHVAVSSGPAPHSPFTPRSRVAPRSRVTASTAASISIPNASAVVDPDAASTTRSPSVSSARTAPVGAFGSGVGAVAVDSAVTAPLAGVSSGVDGGVWHAARPVTARARAQPKGARRVMGGKGLGWEDAETYGLRRFRA